MTWQIFVGFLAAALGSSGLTVLIQTLAGRKKVRADVADTLSDTALALLQAVRDDAAAQIELARKDVASARLEAVEARNEAAAARAEATAARREAMAAAAEMRRLTSEILSPNATIERLRSLVEPGPNGGAGVRTY